MALRILTAFLSAFLLCGPVQGAIISGTWSFSTSSGGTTYSGTFSLSGVDTSTNYTDSTAGFTDSTNFLTNPIGDGFSYHYAINHVDVLLVGGLYAGVDFIQIAPPQDDWVIAVGPVSTGALTFLEFWYVPIHGPTVHVFQGMLTRLNVPEPATLVLIGLGLGGLALMRRRHTS